MNSKRRAFTLIEMMLVTAIILILAGITIASVSYMNRAAAKNKTMALMTKISMGLENYKADFGMYPLNDSAHANRLQATTNNNSDLVTALVGGSKKYVDFTPDETNLMILGGITNVYIYDGYGNPLAYDAASAMSTTPRGTPPNGRVNFTSYDMWSFGPDFASDSGSNVVDDIKNWD